jgi:guanylate kinase
MKRIAVFSGPSGVGKTTLCFELIKRQPDKFGALVSHTTRSPRQGETEGIDYHFVSEEEFHNLKDDGGFVEEVKSRTGYYGLARKEVDRVWERNPFAIFVADVNGALHIKKTFPDQTILTFIVPPSWDDLCLRLGDRGSETRETIEKRIMGSREYMLSIHVYDHVITNKSVDQSVDELEEIFKAEEVMWRTHPKNVDWKHLLTQMEVARCQP